MAVAPTVLDQAAQQLADKTLERIESKVTETVVKTVDDLVGKRFEEQEAKLHNLFKGESARDERTLRGWSRIPKGSAYTPPERPEDLGLRAARVVRAYAAVQGDMVAVPKYLADTLKDKQVSALTEKALETGTPSKGGALTIEEHLAAEFYPLLRDSFPLLELGARVMPMPRGTLTIAGMDSGSRVGWVGETKRGTSSRPSFGRRKLSSKKAYGNVVISNDLFEESDYMVDQIVRDDLVEALGETLFLGSIHGPGSDYSPLGVDKDDKRTLVTVGSLITADVPALFLEELMKAKVKFDETSASWLFGPSIWRQYFNLKTTTGAYHFRDEMREGKLLGHRFRVSTLLEVSEATHKPTHQFFGKWSELIIGVARQMQVEMSREASVRDEDDNEVNAWDEDLTFIKITQKSDSKLRQAKAMAHSNDTWTE